MRAKAKSKPKAKRKRGRPPKITDEAVTDRLIEAIECGNIIETACAVARMGKSTFHRQMEIGEAHAAEGKKTVFRDFWDRVVCARGEAEDAAVRCVSRGMRDDWHAGAWKLTHGPNKAAWADNSKVTLAGDPEAPLRVETQPLSADEWLKKFHGSVVAAMAVPDVVEVPGGGNGRGGNGKEG